LKPVAEVSVSTTLIEALVPFCVDDGHKGTYFVLRIAGLSRASALKTVNRKVRAWKDWYANDPDFKRLEIEIPQLANTYANQAKILRAAMLDAILVETGIKILNDVLAAHTIPDAAWAFISKLAALRMPVMFDTDKKGDDVWAKMANSLKTIVAQREIKVDAVSQTITARESQFQIRPQDTNLAPNSAALEITNIVQNVLNRGFAGGTQQVVGLEEE